MRLLASLAVVVSVAGAADLPYFAVIGKDPGSWPDILASIGLERRPVEQARVLIVRSDASVPDCTKPDCTKRVEQGAILILEGESSLAASFGFHPANDGRKVKVSNLMDIHGPSVSLIWEKGIELPVFDVPPNATVFARERWTGAPVAAGVRRGNGAVFWLAAPPGERGYERFPYILSALADLGLTPPFRSSRLWAFFDSSYRLRVDLDYFAARWRRAGIAALQVAAWHFYEEGDEGDAYLRKLIEACHREGILVYAWLDLPHVSERFWADHPECHEKTALLQDAQLDWRKLINLTNRSCFQAVSAGIGKLMDRFDWDGINLAELYFESLQGISSPSRFTPMNDDVRDLFRRARGFDPIEIFNGRKDEASRRAFLEFRSELAGRMQEEWIGEMEKLRKQKPYLDLVLTHVDDRFDTGMRDAIGADAARVLPLLQEHSVTLLIEDPATVWNQGPQRYHAIAEAYRPLTQRQEKLAIDLNIVSRYQDVYPTKQQTGTELLQLIHSAAASFQRVALYFESSLSATDLKLLSSAAATAAGISREGSKISVESVTGVGVPWTGAAAVDGAPWPVADGETVWLPAGAHSIEPSGTPAGFRLLYFNGELLTAREVSTECIEFSYQSSARAIAILDREPKRLQIDGGDAPLQRAGSATVLLPPGKHVVTIRAD